MKTEINPKNLRRICGLNGFSSIREFARHIGRSHVAVHHAVRNPGQFGPTVALMEKHLPIRKLPHAKPTATPAA